MFLSSTITGVFSVKYWHNLEVCARGSLNSLKMTPIDRFDSSYYYTTSYWSAVVTIALSCTIFELFDVQNIMTLKSTLEVIEGHWKWHYSIDRVRVPICLSL